MRRRFLDGEGQGARCTSTRASGGHDVLDGVCGVGHRSVDRALVGIQLQPCRQKRLHGEFPGSPTLHFHGPVHVLPSEALPTTQRVPDGLRRREHDAEGNVRGGHPHAIHRCNYVRRCGNLEASLEFAFDLASGFVQGKILGQFGVHRKGVGSSTLILGFARYQGARRQTCGDSCVPQRRDWLRPNQPGLERAEPVQDPLHLRYGRGQILPSRVLPVNVRESGSVHHFFHAIEPI
mmetsp:Transcript_61068/g.162147  ORF Transcript_61068/g.162147 Transcript_61068/m.162147 type:complete len:235 (-) Transcript_61068:329-1033(-)